MHELLPYITALRGGCWLSEETLCHLQKEILHFADDPHLMRKMPYAVISVGLGGTHTNCRMMYKYCHYLHLR